LVTTLTALLRKLPVFPMFGDGRTMLQPAHVEDVGEAIARIFVIAQAQSLYELAGPRTYAYKDLLQALSRYLGLRRALIPVPFAAWQTLATFAELLPEAPITRNQVELMRSDNVASSAIAGFATLGIEPRGIEAMMGSN
jgi:NADH dehydrogenase